MSFEYISVREDYIPVRKKNILNTIYNEVGAGRLLQDLASLTDCSQKLSDIVYCYKSDKLFSCQGQLYIYNFGYVSF